MSYSELFKKTVQHIGAYLEEDVSHLTPDSRLDTAVSGLDSLKIFEMTLYLEECFEVDLDESRLERIVTVQDLVDQIEAKLKVKFKASSLSTTEA